MTNRNSASPAQFPMFSYFTDKQYHPRTGFYEVRWQNA
uniref:Uncharacterized protein n=1 Tax=Siphoviridae sp. ctwQg18 TaxID=2826516 RepID=A0A8S5MIL1_9CAUD|nr:MAG TPA: hypothetical protein [Siphoviridae sp. ctwQg18]DAG43952.1 MAG TPA: hypothetical protein [Bacteriophage sp.]DAI92177.1 MAG TPA: hypothetical protein [Caudoviricetes sp.]DAD82217.1 MAG TPA: hypothetical protein [Siphoviridae sp. ctwQg18]DAJ11530.1 MAG TPA: hypothetical protein [Bacteriophage sp.]